MNKDEIYEEVKERAKIHISRYQIPEEGACFIWAVVGTLVLLDRGVRALFQAGSAGWPRIRPEQDDGVTATHFSYMWTPEELPSKRSLKLGLMPEMHCWIGIPEQQELVDFTTGFFPTQAKKICGFDWPGDLPPKYFWGTAAELGRAFYEPHIEAIKYGLFKIRDVFGIHTIRRLMEAR